VPKTPTTAATARSTALVVQDFEPPFSEIDVSSDFVRTHRIKRVSTFQDVRVDTGLIRNVEVRIQEYDDSGRTVSVEEIHRGEPRFSMVFHYDGKRLSKKVRRGADGTGWETTLHYDDAGRLVKEMRGGKWSSQRTMHYDGKGRLSRVDAKLQLSDYSEITEYDESGRILRKTQKKPDGKIIGTREHRYDDEGRAIEWRTKGHRPKADIFRFAYTAKGELRGLLFLEGDSKIYRREYDYDGRGFIREMRMESFVPAMGKGSITRYEYELAEGVTLYRQPPVEKPKKGHTNEELLGAVLKAIPEAYKELSKVSFETTDAQNFAAHSVIVLVPEVKVRGWNEKTRKERACQTRKNLGHGCDCERMEVGPAKDYAWSAWPDKRVVPVTLIFGFGC